MGLVSQNLQERLFHAISTRAEVEEIISILNTVNSEAKNDLSNLTPTAINQALVPNTDNTKDLGTNLKAWRELFTRKVGIAGDTTHAITFTAPPASNTAYLLPVDAGTNDQSLTTDGAGTLSWTGRANTVLSNLSGTDIFVDLVPHGNIAQNIGSATRFWNNTYTDNMHANSLTVGSAQYTLPATDGSSGQQLTTNGAGTLSWTAASSGATTALDNLTTTAINADLTFNKTSPLVQTPAGAGVTQPLTMQTGNTTATNQNTGDVNLNTGTAVNLTNATKHSGLINLATGNSKGISGGVTLTTGTAGNGFSGAGSGTIALTTGTATGTAASSSGYVQLITGAASNVSGSITMQTGSATVAGNQGDIQVNALQLTLVGTQASTPVPLVFQDSTGIGGPFVAFKAPTTVTVSRTYTLPAQDGTSGQQLTTNGSGVLSWAANGGPADKGTATFVAGSVTVASTAVGASSVILVTSLGTAGNAGVVSVPTRVNGVSFTVVSDNGGDTSPINWVLFN